MKNRATQSTLLVLRVCLELLLLLNSVVHQTFSDKAQDELQNWSNNHFNKKPARATDFRGCPVPSLTASLSVGKTSGPLLLADSNLIENLARFNRERIPERSVHAKGTGAFGYFVATRDLTPYTKAKLFSRVGKKTPIVVRLSTVTGELGSADQVQDMRGFSVKFKTEDGNWDVPGINFGIFPIREPLLFSSLLHSRKRNPSTHLVDHNMRWDFDSLRPETTINNLFRQSPLGRPDGYRHMDGFGVHAFKFVNATGGVFFFKLHWKTDQKIKNLTMEQMAEINGQNLDYGTADLYNAIANRNFPSWTLNMQLMTEKEAYNYRYNAFDPTKMWVDIDVPLVPIGKIVLNRNPTDYFTEVEQIAFDPGNFVPGIEASPDKLLHARMFAYADANRQRLGPNFGLIEVNRPRPGVKVRNYNRDGAGVDDAWENGKGGPNYFPNSFDNVKVDPKAQESVYRLNGSVVRYDGVDDDNYSQPRYYWHVRFIESDRVQVAMSIASTLKLTYKFIQRRVLANFRNVDPKLVELIQKYMNMES